MTLILDAGKTFQGVAGTATAITCTITVLERTVSTGAFVAHDIQAQLATSVGVLDTVPAGKEWTTKEIRLVNATASPVSGVKIFIGGAVAANQILQSLTIPANGGAVLNDTGLQVTDGNGAVVFSVPVTLTGDVTGTGSGTIPTVLATFGPGVAGPFGTAGRTPVVTTDAKGRVSALTDVAITPAGIGAPSGSGTSSGANTGDVTIGTFGTSPDAKGATIAGQVVTMQPADATHPGMLSIGQSNFLQNYNGSGIIFVTANSYSNLLCDGSTDDLAALNTLASNAPDASTLMWPGQGRTMVLSAAWSIPSGKHFRCVGGGTGGKTHVLQASQTANHFTVNDWYSTFEGFDFMSINVTFTAVQALTSGTVITINTISTALVPATGSITVGSGVGWQVLTYSARTATTVTLSSTGTGSSTAGAPVVFKTAGNAISAGNNVGINCIDNTFNYCFNGYVASGSIANQSTIAGNIFLNTINFDIQIDAVNWNGIIDSNTCDCATNSRTVSHCEINQCGSITGQGNQFIRGQSNLRLGSTTAAYPAGVFGVQFTNSFFDNAGVDAIKVQGISAVQRIKLTSCWLSSAAVNGLNFASTATTLPSDIELIGCNIYANITAGIAGAGVADYKVIGGQVAQNGTGFLITPATGNVYSVAAEGVRIGPTGGFTANTTGINIATGTYAQIKFDNCDVTGNTTALTLGTVTPVTASRYSFTNNPGINPRGSVGTIAVPATTVSRTNDTGFPVMVVFRAAATTPTNITVNGVSSVLPLANTIATFPLIPGGTIVYTGTSPTWTWIGT